MMNETQQQHRLTESSFIKGDAPNVCVRVLRTVDIFSFLPFPKDEPVSTKRSIIGSLLFFIIFISYVVFDFVNFIQNNPPIQQVYRTSLDDQSYQLPQFAIAFMSNQLSNYTEIYDGLFTYTMQNITKSQGNERFNETIFTVADYANTGNNLTWMSEATKKFYYIMRFPVQDMYVKGLLYSTDENTYVRAKVSYCYNQPYCLDNNTMFQLSNFGRFFLFIEHEPDTSSVSREKGDSNGNNYLLYNFFVIPGFYKRININFQVVETTVMPDYFLDWSPQVTTKLVIESIFEQISVVNYVANNTDAIAFNMQLSPIKLRNKVSRSTIVDHLSMWGALWGVLFSFFAILFLTNNRKKFYQKNPDWDHFKKALDFQHRMGRRE